MSGFYDGLRSVASALPVVGRLFRRNAPAPQANATRRNLSPMASVIQHNSRNNNTRRKANAQGAVLSAVPAPAMAAAAAAAAPAHAPAASGAGAPPTLAERMAALRAQQTKNAAAQVTTQAKLQKEFPGTTFFSKGRHGGSRRRRGQSACTRRRK